MSSQTATSILTLLNNIEELIRISQDRKNAQEVMRCLVVYANNNSFPLPTYKINNFHRVCIDSKPNTLTHLIYDIAKDIIHEDKLREKENRKKNA